MARKDPPGSIYVGDGIWVTAERTFERDIVKIKISRQHHNKSKTGMKLQITYEAINRYEVGEGMEYPHQKPDEDGKIV